MLKTNKMKIGCHVAISALDGDSKGQQIINALLLLPEIGANAVQIFLSPRNGASSGRPLKQDEADEIDSILQGSRSYLVIHGKYDLNFCDPNVRWYQDALIADLKKASQINDNIGVVIHQGKNVTRLGLTKKQAQLNYVRQVSQVLAKTDELKNPIFLENSCQQGTELGYDLEGLAEIWNLFTDQDKKRLGFCLDTCHIFVAGTLQMKDNNDVDNFFNEFDRLLGIENLKLIHFNDSKTPFDGHNDHHHDILGGFITNPDYLSPVKKYQKVSPDQAYGSIMGLSRVLTWAKKYDIPCILETPQEIIRIQEQLEVVQDWADNIDTKNIKLNKPKKIVLKKKLQS